MDKAVIKHGTYNREEVRLLLTEMCPKDAIAQGILVDKRRSIESNVISEMMGCEKISRDQLLPAVMSGMATYISKYPASQIFKQKLWIHNLMHDFSSMYY